MWISNKIIVRRTLGVTRMFEEVLKSLGLSDEQITALMEAKSQDETGLKSKNQELLDKLSKNKGMSTEQEAELERLRQLENKTKISSAEAKENYDAALKLANDTHQLNLEKASQDAEKWKGMFSQVAIDNALNAQLEQAGVTNPALKQGAIAMLKPQISLGEDGTAIAGEQKLDEFVSGFAQSDIGKAFVTLADNSGGSAHQGSSNVGQYDGKKLSDLGSDERRTLMNEQPEVYAELKERN